MLVLVLLQPPPPPDPPSPTMTHFILSWICAVICDIHQNGIKTQLWKILIELPVIILMSLNLKHLVMFCCLSFGGFLITFG